jgi:site-specific recombinase XerD
MEPNASVTVSYTVPNNTWKNDGTNLVRLRFTFKRQGRFVKTNLIVHRKDMVGQRIKNSDIRRKAEELIERMEKAISHLDCFALQSMTIDQVVQFVVEDDEGFKLDFFEFADKIIAEKKGQPAKSYRTAVNAFRSYIGNDTLDISEISSPLMRDWERFLVAKYGEGARAVSAYPACIAFIHGQARLRYNREEDGILRIKNPFQFYKPPRQKTGRHRALEIEDIQNMIDIRGGLKGREKLGVDVFLISFVLVGMNAPDLYTCNLRGEDVLHYYRTKTRTRRDDKAEMFVTIDKKVESLIKEYFAPEGSETAFDFCNRYKNYVLFGENVNEGLKKYSDRIGRTDKNDRITLYWARHSWATIAYACGVDKGVINDGLCHVDRDMKVTDIYIKKNWKIIWDGNAKVIKKFKWK